MRSQMPVNDIPEYYKDFASSADRYRFGDDNGDIVADILNKNIPDWHFECLKTTDAVQGRTEADILAFNNDKEFHIEVKSASKIPEGKKYYSGSINSDYLKYGTKAEFLISTTIDAYNKMYWRFYRMSDVIEALMECKVRNPSLMNLEHFCGLKVHNFNWLKNELH